jgi:hypothetical protein
MAGRPGLLIRLAALQNAVRHTYASVVTEQERLDRGALLKRAAAFAGSVYVAPVVVPSAAAPAPATCPGQPCTPGPKGDRMCARKGGPSCKCLGGRCSPSNRCNAQPCVGCSTCQFAYPGECDRGNPNCLCACLGAGGRDGCVCVEFHCCGCSVYPPCDRYGDGSDCPPGMCCVDAFYCFNGLCVPPCRLTPTP